MIKWKPSYIKEKLYSLEKNQFGFDVLAWRFKSKNYRNYIVGKKDIYIGGRINNFKRIRISKKVYIFTRCSFTSKFLLKR